MSIIPPCDMIINSRFRSSSPWLMFRQPFFQLSASLSNIQTHNSNKRVIDWCSRTEHQWHSQSLPGWASRPPGRPKWVRKFIRKDWGKIREHAGKWGKIEELFLSCPPGSERLATALTSINFDITVNCDVILVATLAIFQELIRAYETSSGWGSIMQIKMFPLILEVVLKF